MHTFVIAEAGINHNGSLQTAKKLADAAKTAQVDCIKFQTFVPENLVTGTAEMAEYQKENVGKSSSQLRMLQELAFSFDEFRELKKYCDEIGLLFVSTPFDFDSINFLDSLGLPFWKIPSGEITNFPYLRMIAKTRKPVVLSTGMSTLAEIEEAVNVLERYGSQNISLLHCTTEYPAPIEEINLKAIKMMNERFGVPTGYSDHTQGILAPIIAVGVGAVIIEKHFTLDKHMKGPDHKASLEPEELTEMVKQIRKAEKMLSGTGIKERMPSEEKNMAVARKSIVAKVEIKKGEVFTEDNLTTKRPGTGLNPMKWENVIGQKAKKDFKVDEFIIM